MNKKKKKEIEVRLRQLEIKTQNNKERIDKLEGQIACGIRGHNLCFADMKTMFYVDFFNFKCSCGVKVAKFKSQLTPKEITALKTLKLI